MNYEELEYYKSFQWQLKKWMPVAALIEKKSGSSHLYMGQAFDPFYFELVKDGWNHDHCEICSVVFCSNPNECETEGYEAAANWICKGCYLKYLSEENE